MSRFLQSLLLFNLFIDTLGFNLYSLSVKPLRNINKNVCHMSLDRRDFISKPAIASISVAALIPFTVQKVCASELEDAKEADDYWTKHNGKFSEDFLNDMTKKESGLLYKDITIGKGEIPKDGDAATIQIVGYIYETGEKWTNTYKGIPAFQSVIRVGSRPNQKYMKGLNEGIADMKRGGKRVLVIPAYLAYSYLTIYSEKDPSVEIIPGGSSLVCYVEMIDFRTLK